MIDNLCKVEALLTKNANEIVKLLIYAFNPGSQSTNLCLKPYFLNSLVN